MKKVLVVVFIWVIVVAFIFPGTKADVISKSGQWLTINKGSTDGVKIGMIGIVKTVMVESGKTYDINVGVFEIKKVKEKTSEALITKLAPGMNAEQAKYVLFDQNLKPPVTIHSTSEKSPKGIPKQKTGTRKQESPTETIPTGKPVDWYLEKGDEYCNKGKYQVAQKYYQHMLKIDPADPIAPKKISGCEQMIHRSKEERKFYSYIERADKYFSQNKVDYALEYYLAAYKLLPSKLKMVADKFKKVSGANPKEWGKFKDEHSSELQSILYKYFIPSEFNKIKPKAKRVYKNKKGYWEAEFDYNIVMIYIPEGEFLMGSNEGENDEKPVHTVFLDGYWIGKYEVTLGQWKAVMGSNPSRFKSRDHYPVERVSWNDVQQFILTINSRVGLFFRLPTEAEWEKAARGTDRRKYPWGNASSSCSLANYYKCVRKMKPVGSYPLGISPYGVHDMAGNVWEWCSDWYSSSYYTRSPRKNPTGPSSGTYRVMRGGSWYVGAAAIRCALRVWHAPSAPDSGLGFRLCME